MDEVAFRKFRTRSGERERASNNMESGPSVQKMSRELERLFAPPTELQTEIEEKKENDSIEESHSPNHLLYSSPKRGIPITPSPVITPTRQDSGIQKEDENPNEYRPTNESSRHKSNSSDDETEDISFASCMQPALNQQAANAMARHVVTKLRKEAAALLKGNENRKENNRKNSVCIRAASPIARMRDRNFQSETMMVENEQRQQPRKESKSYEEDEKEQRRKQWKRKAKIAQAKQHREQKSLQDEYTIGSQSQFSNNNPILGCVLDNVERTDFFNRLAQCSGGLYNRTACAPGEFEEYGYGSSSSIESDDDSTTEDDTTEDDFRVRSSRRQLERGQDNKKWENHSLDSSSADTTVPEEMTRSFLVSDDGSDHHDDATGNLSRNELNHSLENRSDFAFAGFSSAYSGRASTASGSKTSRINHTAVNRLVNHIRGPGFEKAFLQDMESKGQSMLWHQVSSSMHPSSVVIRIKKGYRMPSGKFCSPRLIWTDIRSNQNYGFDIFDIKSLDHASMLHLKDFPYAIPGRSVLLHLNNSSTFIFEAGTEVDMVRFVSSIKQIIAKLTYNLVTGNLNGSSELLDLGLEDLKQIRQTRGRTQSETDWRKAMDDVTEAMIDSAMVSTTFEV